MSEPTPPGFYDDGSGRQRWWSGAEWTEHYAEAVPLSAQSPPSQQTPVSQPMPAGWYDNGRGTQQWWTGETWVPTPAAPPAPQGKAPAQPEAWSGLAIAAFVCGVFGVFCIVPGIAALIMGIFALKDIRTTHRRGGGLAKWGIGLGCVAAVAAVFVATVFGLGTLIKGDFSTTSSCINGNGDNATGC